MEEMILETVDIEVVSGDSYEVQSELNDMKQHADKIIQGIKKLDINDANRAIWELFQNAVDLSDKCHINIKLTDSSLYFNHNGEPFTPMTLDCLFKQVSSKTLEEKKLVYDENDPVGQYGTGFITTHAFGKEVVINGGLLKDTGYVPLDNFVIDRSTDNWKELANRIRTLKKRVASLLNTGLVKPRPYPNTTFEYITATKHDHDYATKAISSLRLVLPYVMTLNPNLEWIVVTDKDGSETRYEQRRTYATGEMQVRVVGINEDEQSICYLQSADKKTTIVLPVAPDLKAFDLDERLPRLFLYYPLVGTQNFGVNFIIHSRNFQPTEPRNGLYLKSDNDATGKEEAVNTLLIQQSSDIILNFVEANSNKISSPISLATINFNIESDNLHLNEYFQLLKVNWISKFKSYPIVETEEGNISPSEAVFFSEELLKDDSKFEAIFALINKFWKNIPKESLVKRWTKIVIEWNVEEITYVSIKELVLRIEKEGSLKAFSEQEELKQFYEYLIEQSHTDLFNIHKLLPNIKGEFRQIVGKEGLNKSLNLPEELIKIADVIMPDIPKRHVHQDFQFTLEFTEYSRKNYTTEINDHISKQVGEKATGKIIPEAFLHKLIEYCSITTTHASSSVPIRMVQLVSRYYNQSEQLIVIPAIKDDELDIRAPQRRLLRVFLNDISNEESAWVTEKLSFLKDVISAGANYYDYEDMFQTLAVFPNQLNELKEQTYLRIDDKIPDDIKDLYDRVVKADLPIRANLVHPDFTEYLKNKTKKITRDLTEKIEAKFFDDQAQYSISNHPFKEEILQIIGKLKFSSEYEKFYPLIFSKRSVLLVELADGADTFSILSLSSSKIKKLAELGNNPQFEEIVRLGKEALLKQQQENANFQHKYAIGTHIEDILRKSLANLIPESIQAEVKNVQDGQDIIIKIGGNEVYFIEVKSRWDVNNSVRMSKNQTLKAYQQKHNYALCSIDMTKYQGANRLNVKSIDEIKSLIWFNRNIGTDVTHLIDIFNQTNDLEAIHIDGDYRTLVPMKYIEGGESLDQFEIYLIQFLSNYNVQPN